MAQRKRHDVFLRVPECEGTSGPRPRTQPLQMWERSAVVSGTIAALSSVPCVLLYVADFWFGFLFVPILILASLWTLVSACTSRGRYERWEPRVVAACVVPSLLLVFQIVLVARSRG